MAHVTDKRPGFKYIWVNPNDTLFGVDYYLGLGADVVQKSEDGPKQIGSRGVNPFRKQSGTEASYLMFQGQVLMQMTQELAEEIEQRGPDGNSGQEDWDRIERQMHGQSIAARLGRGIPSGSDGAPLIGFQYKANAGFAEPEEIGV